VIPSVIDPNSISISDCVCACWFWEKNCKEEIWERVWSGRCPKYCHSKHHEHCLTKNHVAEWLRFKSVDTTEFFGAGSIPTYLFFL